MRLSPSILVPLDGSAASARGLGCAAWLAAKLGSRLHILSATDRSLPAREELSRLRVAEEYWPAIELHQAPSFPESAILSAIADFDVGLVLMTAHGAALDQPAYRPSPTSAIGHVTRGVIERAMVPVVLMPLSYREELPWRTLVVPVSGDVAGDEALVVAAHLGNVLNLSIRVVHVADPSAKQEPLELRMRYADAPHHEFSAQLDELVVRVLPSLAPEERARIHGISLRDGAVVDELLALTNERGSVLVAGWHGQLLPGRATILKALLPATHGPVVLVRSGAPPHFRLKVADDFA